MRKWIQKIFFDTLWAYKNFFHWNIMKILFFVYSLGIALLSALPFIIILFIYIFVSDIQWLNLLSAFSWGTIWIEEIANVSENIFSFIFGILLVIISGSFLYLWFSYSKIYLNTLSLEYIKWKKMPFFSKSYFCVKKVWKFFQLSFWKILILSIPFIIFIIFMIILMIIVWGEEQIKAIIASSTFNYFTILSLLSFLLCAGVFLYLYIRIYFANIIFAEVENDDKKALDYIKKSFSLTKSYKKIAWLMLVFLVLGLCAIPFNMIGKYIETSQKDLDNYQIYSSETDENKELLKWENPYYYEELELSYSTLEASSLSRKILIYNMYMVLFNIFSLLVVYGLIEMVSVSFYKRVL